MTIKYRVENYGDGHAVIGSNGRVDAVMGDKRSAESYCKNLNDKITFYSGDQWPQETIRKFENDDAIPLKINKIVLTK